MPKQHDRLSRAGSLGLNNFVLTWKESSVNSKCKTSGCMSFLHASVGNSRQAAYRKDKNQESRVFREEKLQSKHEKSSIIAQWRDDCVWVLKINYLLSHSKILFNHHEDNQAYNLELLSDKMLFINYDYEKYFFSIAFEDK